MSSLKNLFGSSKAASTQSIMDRLAKDRQTVEETVEKAVVEQEEQDDEEEEEEEEEIKEQPVQKKAKKSKKNDKNDDLEGEYMAKLMKQTEKEQLKQQEAKNGQGKPLQESSVAAESNDDSDNDDSEEEEKVEEAKPATVIELKEKELEKAERTIFVGNVPLSVLTDKKVYTKFKKHFSTNPQKLDDVEDEQEQDELKEQEDKEQEKNPFDIESIRFRSIAFSEALPRKVAFSQLKFDEKRDSLNSYIVYKNRNIKKLNKSIKSWNGQVFENHHLRVDSVTHPAAQDRKRSIFVGNLDFEEIEESLWKHFSKTGKIEYVRIVRDSKTNMGKGFAYVQFVDSSDVNKALLLNDKPISSTAASKARKLRISRCKNLNKGGNTSNNNKKQENNANLNNQQKTKIGRANKVLGKMDKKTLGKELTIEGERALKINKNANSVLGKRKRKPRSKDGRAAKRSAAHKQKISESEAKK